MNFNLIKRKVKKERKGKNSKSNKRTRYLLIKILTQQKNAYVTFKILILVI